MRRAPDLLLLGRTFTADPAAPWAEGVAIADGAIAAVGSRRELRELAGSRTEVREVDGLVCPAFADAHIHLIEGSLFDLWCDLHDTPPGDYLAVVERHARDLPAGAWLRGGGWSMAAFPGGSPTREPLDAVAGDRPVYLTARDGHSAWVNARALEIAGVDRTTADPPGGTIERGPDGEPTGCLHETAMRLVAAHLPPITLEDWRAALALGQRRMHALGITSWQEARMDPGTPMVPAYRCAADDGALYARVVLALHWRPDRGLEQLAELEEIRRETVEPDVFATTAKFFVDGVLENHTAALDEPYVGVAPETRGKPLFEPAVLREAVAACTRAGFQAHFHAIGDRAVRDALDACEHARREVGAHDLRHHVSHLQVVAPSDVPRFAQLGVVANAQPYWACVDEQMRELCLPVLGEQRRGWQYPFGSLREAGATIAMGSDWRVSTPDPLKQIEVAVTRREEGRSDAEALGPEEALTLTDALLGFTRNAAFVNHLERVTGTLEVGKSADVVLLDRDPFGCAPSEIGTVEVDATYLRGMPVYERS